VGIEDPVLAGKPVFHGPFSALIDVSGIVSDGDSCLTPFEMKSRIFEGDGRDRGFHPRWKLSYRVL
jgi:hypothetical protein